MTARIFWIFLDKQTIYPQPSGNLHLPFLQVACDTLWEFQTFWPSLINQLEHHNEFLAFKNSNFLRSFGLSSVSWPVLLPEKKFWFQRKRYLIEYFKTLPRYTFFIQTWKYALLARTMRNRSKPGINSATRFMYKTTSCRRNSCRRCGACSRCWAYCRRFDEFPYIFL